MNEAIRQVVAEAVGRELGDPRLELVTITEVRATSDLREAKVFFTVLDPSRREGTGRALESARGVLQGRIARALGTRQTPHLTFVYDEHQERATRLTHLIDSVEPGPAPPEDAP